MEQKYALNVKSILYLVYANSFEQTVSRRSCNIYFGLYKNIIFYTLYFKKLLIYLTYKC